MEAISTHTPHARCDGYLVLAYVGFKYFYSHTSCEVRHFFDKIIALCISFLLTHLMRGATNISRS